MNESFAASAAGKVLDASALAAWAEEDDPCAAANCWPQEGSLSRCSC
jgi:hypothetical protein